MFRFILSCWILLSKRLDGILSDPPRDQASRLEEGIQVPISFASMEQGWQESFLKRIAM